MQKHTEERRKLTEFGKAVKVRMMDIGMRQNELAKRIGTSESMLCGILYGERSATNWMHLICAELNMNAKRFETNIAKKRCDTCKRGTA